MPYIQVVSWRGWNAAALGCFGAKVAMANVSMVASGSLHVHLAVQNPAFTGGLVLNIKGDETSIAFESGAPISGRGGVLMETGWLETLKERLGGKWDGHESECHGLVQLYGVPLKIEILQVDEQYTCTIFRGGAAVCDVSDPDPRRAVATALKKVRDVL